MNLEQLFYEQFNRTIRYMKVQPINLGGVASVSGGSGGPPGGFIGYLPQTRVSYDLSEDETLVVPSGPSLVDNLNHIRYRINDVETDLGRIFSVNIKSTNYGLNNNTDYIIICSGSMVLSVSGATGTGNQYVIKSVYSGSVTVSGVGLNTFDDSTVKYLGQYDSITIVDYALNKWAII